MTSVNHPKKLCPFLDQRCWIGEPSSSPSKRGHLPSSQTPFETVSQHPKGPLTRLSDLSHPLNRTHAGSQIPLLSPARRLKIQVA
jgi:hypothetical protein